MSTELDTAMDGLSLQALENLEKGKKIKEDADQAFKGGKFTDALRGYHTALLYLRGLNKSNPMAKEGENTDGKPKNEIEEIQAKIYSNMSACHLKNSNWHRTIETADKALALDKENVKASFRKAKALGETGYFEKAEAIMTSLLERNPPDANAIRAELEAQRVKDKERQKKHNQKLRGWLSRDKTVLEKDDSPVPNVSTATEETSTAKIEEVEEGDAEEKRSDSE